jgi:hypothetical protein
MSEFMPLQTALAAISRQVARPPVRQAVEGIKTAFLSSIGIRGREMYRKAGWPPSPLQPESRREEDLLACSVAGQLCWCAGMAAKSMS